MRLHEFIISSLDAILVDWVAFAREQLPAALHIDEIGLLDHGRLILEEIAADMRRPQNSDERQSKSEGNSTIASTSRSLPSRSHARQRERQGFEIEQMVAEYRALRATVLRLWFAASNVAHHQDLEDVTRFNEAVDQAIAESLQVFVAEVDRSRDLFLGILGHDLRGPLSTIASCATLDLRAHPADPRHAAVTLRSVARMKSLLDDLVEYTRHRLRGGLAVDPTRLDLARVVRDTLDEIDAIGLGHALELATAGDMQGDWDVRRLHQALSNLVFNAVKYGLPGTPVRITLDGSAEQGMIVAVENDGKRIPSDLLPALFDPLVRATGESEGVGADVGGANLGLGLYVVRQIAAAHGGSVQVTSDDAVTRFEMRLPRSGSPARQRGD